MVRMDISSIVVGAGPVVSMVVLQPREQDTQHLAKLPIHVGPAEATAVGMGVNNPNPTRPLTHDLLVTVISRLGAKVSSVAITDVQDATFFATVDLVSAAGERFSLDARPSDAIAVAVRTKSPIYVDDRVLKTAAYPNLAGVKADEKEREAKKFHEFVSGLYPDDFANS